MRKTALGCTILEGHDIADLPLVSENSEILEREIKRIEQEGGKVKSINGKTGEINITKSDVGLSNVDNVKQASKAEFDGHKADYIHHTGYGVASGTNAKTITLDPIPSGYVEGMAISFKNTTQNTGEVTINVNGLGAKKILKSNGKELSSGNLQTGSIYTIRYNGTNFILQGEGGDYVILEREAQRTLVPTIILPYQTGLRLISPRGTKACVVGTGTVSVYELLEYDWELLFTINDNAVDPDRNQKYWIMDDGSFYFFNGITQILSKSSNTANSPSWRKAQIKLVDVRQDDKDDSVHRIAAVPVAPNNYIHFYNSDGVVVWTNTQNTDNEIKYIIASTYANCAYIIYKNSNGYYYLKTVITASSTLAGRDLGIFSDRNLIVDGSRGLVACFSVETNHLILLQLGMDNVFSVTYLSSLGMSGTTDLKVGVNQEIYYSQQIGSQSALYRRTSSARLFVDEKMVQLTDNIKQFSLAFKYNQYPEYEFNYSRFVFGNSSLTSTSATDKVYEIGYKKKEG